MYTEYSPEDGGEDDDCAEHRSATTTMMTMMMMLTMMCRLKLHRQGFTDVDDRCTVSVNAVCVNCCRTSFGGGTSTTLWRHNFGPCR